MKHFLEHLAEHPWNSLLLVNSALCALACGYLVYGAGASIYYLTPWPFELGVILVFVLICTEVAISILEETYD